MSESRQTKPSKSKSRNQNPLVKGHHSTSTGNVIHNNFSFSSTNFSYEVSGLPALAMGGSSIMGKTDMDHLKQATFKNIRSSLGSPTARDDCINYALEMVISNLIINGRLDPAKAQNMRTPLMKAQIASICDNMLKTKLKDPLTGTKSAGNGGVKKTKTGGSFSKQKSQKWALQPAALPITVVTDQVSNPSAQGFIHGGIKQFAKGITKDNSSGSFKPYLALSAENIKKKEKKKKAKSLDSSTIQQISSINQKNLLMYPSLLSKHTPTQPPPQINVAGPVQVQAESGQGGGTNTKMSFMNSSEVPSYQSIQPNNYEEDGNTDRRNGATGESSTGKSERTVQFGGSTVEKSPLEAVSTTYNTTEEGASIMNDKANGDKPSMPLTPVVPFAGESRCQSAGAESTGSTKTLNALINSCSSISSSNTNGFHILVDMKGFLNDEISMEVEGRQLIFLASRPKRNDLNIRKVTEIVEIPPGVNLESLKIGRRVDGLVIVEEYEAEAEKQ